MEKLAKEQPAPFVERSYPYEFKHIKKERA